MTQNDGEKRDERDPDDDLPPLLEQPKSEAKAEHIPDLPPLQTTKPERDSRLQPSQDIESVNRELPALFEQASPQYSTRQQTSTDVSWFTPDAASDNGGEINDLAQKIDNMQQTLNTLTEKVDRILSVVEEDDGARFS